MRATVTRSLHSLTDCHHSPQARSQQYGNYLDKKKVIWQQSGRLVKATELFRLSPERLTSFCIRPRNRQFLCHAFTSSGLCYHAIKNAPRARYGPDSSAEARAELAAGAVGLTERGLAAVRKQRGRQSASGETVGSVRDRENVTRPAAD